MVERARVTIKTIPDMAATTFVRQSVVQPFTVRPCQEKQECIQRPVDVANHLDLQDVTFTTYRQEAGPTS